MNKTRIITFVIALGVVAVLLGFFLIPNQSEDRRLPESASQHRTPLDLGMTYLPITPGLAAYYGLGVDCGALVTEVTPGSSADAAGVQIGDVIISFNGARLERGTPLLGMMMACPAGDTVTLKVWREAEVRMIELFHGTR